MKKYEKVVQLDDLTFKPIGSITVNNKLEAGVYEVNQSQQGEIFFVKIRTNHDDLIDLPSEAYDTVIKEIELFMLPETRQKFKENGFLYKRSSLLYGPPGTGKTCIVNRIAHSVQAEGGVVFFSPNPRLLEEAFKIMDSIQPETRIMVIFEELDQLMNRYESELLNILDGEIQKSNVIFIATTNHLDKIPARIRRPGRFSSVVEVTFPTAETRAFYLNYKFKGKLDITEWVKKTNGFSVDELKETALSVLCLSADLDKIIKRIRENKGEYVETDPVASPPCNNCGYSDSLEGWDEEKAEDYDQQPVSDPLSVKPKK
jgi:SpoVK/Ycf46/Vps4 family AAA+-type ATPase